MFFNLRWIQKHLVDADVGHVTLEDDEGHALDDDHVDNHGDDHDHDDDAGGDPFNETSFFTQPCWTCTWKSTSQPQDPVQICRDGTGGKLLRTIILINVKEKWHMWKMLTNYHLGLLNAKLFTQSVGYLGRTELEEVKSIEQVEMFNEFDNGDILRFL